jgi:hypothetical protein
VRRETALVAEAAQALKHLEGRRLRWVVDGLECLELWFESDGPSDTSPVAVWPSARGRLLKGRLDLGSVAIRAMDWIEANP